MIGSFTKHEVSWLRGFGKQKLEGKAKGGITLSKTELLWKKWKPIVENKETHEKKGMKWVCTNQD